VNEVCRNYLNIIVELCAALNCHNNNTIPGLSSYQVSSSLKRHNLNEAAVNRIDTMNGQRWRSSEHNRLCSNHFIFGEITQGAKLLVKTTKCIGLEWNCFQTVTIWPRNDRH
jgi:hypothetical protein